MKGRKPIPSNIHLLQGGTQKTHRSKDYRADEPKPQAAIPKCPKNLDKEAKREWKRIIKELEPLGMLTNLDRAVCATYCQAWSTWTQATEKLKGGAMVAMGKTGPIINPHYQIVKQANEQMMRALIEMGMTPSSRSRVKANPKEKGDELEDFLKENRG